ncbi:hypothetical protein PENFLA_c015G08788 [Penicillium flavigenum]|uniref:Integrase catalytic domain-containing protein n=1 Tax=Penicillium flavigenum TaxID=254877 RepID=A0A1V6T3R9_9EURO|nr:hypothetical protein PENFLA_c015G08788 [Penicillium flavigenum]
MPANASVPTPQSVPDYHRVDTSWKPTDIGYFYLDVPDKEGVELINNIPHYTNVEIFLNRMRKLVVLKSEQVVRGNIHACLKGSSLRWYTHELSRDTKDLMQLALDDEDATRQRRFDTTKRPTWSQGDSDPNPRVDPSSDFFTTAYHPQADGQSERTNQAVEIVIRHWCAQQSLDNDDIRQNPATSRQDEALLFI